MPARLALGLIVLGALVYFGGMKPKHEAVAQTSAPPLVVVSLPPLHSLVAGVMEGIATPELLYQKGMDPHHFTLKPSDAGLLQKADAVVILSNTMEGYFQTFIDARGKQKKAVIQAISSPGINLFPAPHYSDQDKDDNNALPDTHLWLDPFNAIAFVQYFTTEIINIDPKNARTYERNANKLMGSIRATHQGIEKRFLKISPPPRDSAYASYHPSLQYFEKRYQIEQAHAVTATPEAGVSMEEAQNLNALLAKGQVRCLYTEPNYSSKLLRKIAKKYPSVKIQQIDPLGGTLEPSPELYVTMLKSVADAVLTCIEKPKVEND